MIFRIFLALSALFAAYILFNVGQLVWVKNAVSRVADPAFATGPKDAELKIVEFLDYSCPRCRATHPVLVDALESEQGPIRYIPRPLSTDNEEGRKAAWLVYAAGLQGKFFEAHETLIRDFHTIDDTYIETLAKGLKIDAAKLKQDMSSPELQKIVEKNAHYNEVLGSHTIPTIFINDWILWIVMGDAPDIQTVKNVIEESKRK
ncbi:MAG: thioredoxin domain-containing protein [Micavibrio sp.]|nr:thioredoxin domain-containing protein [Micavibrio sp.]